MNNDDVYYPIAIGNTWTYNDGMGGQFTNSIIKETAPGEFLVNNSLKPDEHLLMKKEGGVYYADVLYADNMQMTLKDDLQVGDTWELTFKANGFDNVLVYTVKELLPSKTVEGREFNDVAMIEAESKMIVNGNLMSINFFTQYDYAKGVGAILTTSSAGSSMPLLSFDLK